MKKYLEGNLTKMQGKIGKPKVNNPVEKMEVKKKKDILPTFYYKTKAMNWIFRSQGEPKHCEKFHWGELKSRRLKMNVNLMQIFRR